MTAPIYVHTLECKPIFDNNRSDARESLEVHGIYASKRATNAAARSLVKREWDDEQLQKEAEDDEDFYYAFILEYGDKVTCTERRAEVYVKKWPLLGFPL